MGKPWKIGRVDDLEDPQEENRDEDISFENPRRKELEALRRDITEAIENPEISALKGLEIVIQTIETERAVNATLLDDEVDPDYAIEEISEIFFNLILTESLKKGVNDPNLQKLLNVLCGEIDHKYLLANRLMPILHAIVDVLEPLDALVAIEILKKLREKLLEEFGSDIIEA